MQVYEMNLSPMGISIIQQNQLLIQYIKLSFNVHLSNEQFNVCKSGES